VADSDSLLKAGRLLGVIDIGSNSIRLVVFDAGARAPTPIFNEKVLCAIGRDIDRTGRLSAEGGEQALENIRRFAALARAMGVREMELLATAAVRDARDGKEFAAAIRRGTGYPVRILTGAEEARFSALGVYSGIPDAEGVMGDLGGGSLELVHLDAGRIGPYATLPLGPLRLAQAEAKGRKWLRQAIDERLAALEWLDRGRGRDFYAVGGAWRSLARLHMAKQDYPLRVIHHYAVRREEALEFLDLVAAMGKSQMALVAEVSRRRVETLPIAATVLARVLLRMQPAQLVFSAMGLREGSAYAHLPRARRRVDPLIDGCERMAGRNARFAVSGRTLAAWVEPVMRTEVADPAEQRLVLAACLLGDIAWHEHPDYRAEIAFLRVLRAQLVGIDHAGRAFMAVALHTRYGGPPEEPRVAAVARRLLSAEGAARALRLGRALRLAFALSGGAPAVLRRVTLEADRQTLRLLVPKTQSSLIGEAVERRLEHLAASIGLARAIDYR